MEFLSVAALKDQACDQPLRCAVDAELQSRAERQTKNSKPYLILSFTDSTGAFSINAWSDSPLFEAAGNFALGSVLRLDAEWTQTSFGLNAGGLTIEPLADTALESFYTGDSSVTEKQQSDWLAIRAFCEKISDPRLVAICRLFFDSYGERFRRTGAARKNHHARRGGLVEHVAQMMRTAAAICGVYPHLNRDLMIAGVLFHDSGKLWENQYPEKGFSQNHSVYGEMLGHIPMGIELVNKLWQTMMSSAEANDWLTLEPTSEDVRLHLLHLIAAHHGQHEFGSPVLPRTPEAFALHYIDNLDAKLEMVQRCYAESKLLAPHIYEKQFPLPANLVEPLDPYLPEAPDGTF